MKRSLNLALVTIGFIFFFVMCKKENQNNNTNTPPVVMQFSKGILATVGINGIHVLDTIHFRNSSTSGNIPSLFSYEGSLDYPASGWYVRPRDFWELINSGTNAWHIKNNAGYYLGYEFNPNGTGNNKYTITLDLVPGDTHLFVMNKTGANNFYIQPVANKNVFLNSLPADVQPPNPAHTKGRFLEGTKQLWFLIP
jgi:hypothetical protein